MTNVAFSTTGHQVKTNSLFSGLSIEEFCNALADETLAVDAIKLDFDLALIATVQSEWYEFSASVFPADVEIGLYACREAPTVGGSSANSVSTHLPSLGSYLFAYEPLAGLRQSLCGWTLDQTIGTANRHTSVLLGTLKGSYTPPKGARQAGIMGSDEDLTAPGVRTYPIATVVLPTPITMGSGVYVVSFDFVGKVTIRVRKHGFKNLLPLLKEG